MGQDHIDWIKRGIEAFNRGDWDTALEGIAEDVVWTAFLARLDGEKSIYGHEALKRTWTAQRDALGGESYKVEAQDFRDLGAGAVLVPIRITARGTGSGVPLEIEYVQLWTFRQGLAVRIDIYADVAEALEDAGLSE